MSDGKNSVREIVRTWAFAVSSMFLLIILGCDGPPGGAASTAPQAPQAPSAPAAPAPIAMERVEAGVGVGLKGRRLDQDHIVDAIAQPAKSFFAAKERIAFEIAVPHALNLFKATEGRAPKSHEEFMEKIVNFNQIQLPELPPGHVYVYDPATEELMVERPQAAAAQPTP